MIIHRKFLKNNWKYPIFYAVIFTLTQLSQISIKIGGFDSASRVSFHHKAYHLVGSRISLAAVVSANPS